MGDVFRCDGCDRRMVRQGEDKAPGAVQYAGNGRCTSCASRVRKGIPLPGHDYVCVVCDELIDTGYGGCGPKPSSGGWCFTCARKESEEDRGARVCEGGCGFELFRSDQRPVKGKRRHLREGMCYPCYRRATKAPLDEAQALALVPELSAMMRARKARQEKQARVEKARAVEYQRFLHYRKTRQPA